MKFVFNMKKANKFINKYNISRIIFQIKLELVLNSILSKYYFLAINYLNKR